MSGIKQTVNGLVHTLFLLYQGSGRGTFLLVVDTLERARLDKTTALCDNNSTRKIFGGNTAGRRVKTEVSMKQGILTGVGVGPGDPRLMTVMALDALKAAPVISFPQQKGAYGSAFEIARRALAEIAGTDIAAKELLPLDLPMTRDAGILRQGREKAAAQVSEKLAAGKDTAFITLGDPSIYSTFGYLRLMVTQAGFQTRAIPGIPSFCAAAAALGEDLVLWEEPLHIIPASYEDVEGAAALTGTRVLMKSGSALSEIHAMLKKRGISAKTRVVENCGMEGERVWKSIDELGYAAPGYFTLLIIKEGGR